jgi:hypothetical protein
VVERPERPVGEALVVVGDVISGQPDGHEMHAVGVERFRRQIGDADPPHPGAGVAPHDRLERGDEPPGACPPFDPAVDGLDAVHRQSVGDHHEVAAPVGRSAHAASLRATGSLS